MKVHDLIQGSPEWLSYRTEHFNASDAPAMMGVSPYKTRTQLLHEMHTGIAADVDEATQRRFDDGHRVEALARPLAEEIIGEDLYPVVGSKGKLSMSSDGLTMDQKKGFEHKALNDELRACMRQQGGNANDFLPPLYRIQMEQQCMVGDTDTILFMASKWNGDELVEARHCWYTPDAELRAQIQMGWEQFEKDLAEYTPHQVVAESIGRTPETLPALHIEVTGMVTASNLVQFKDHALGVFKGINRELTTDQHFADAEKTVKWCGDVEDRLKAAKQHALSQTASIDALFRTIDDIIETSRATRLELDKLVKARKEAVRDEILGDGKKNLAKHLEALNVRLGKPYMPTITADFAGVIKGKRSIDSIRDAVSTELARAKISSNEIADMIQLNLATLRDQAADYKALFPDTAQLVLKPNDMVGLIIKQRIADHKAEIEAEAEKARERIAQQERDKLAEQQRQFDEQERTEIARLAKLNNGDMVQEAPAPQAATPAPAVNVVAMPSRAPVAPSTPPSLKLGQIAERLGFTLTADFLKQLGFEPAATDRASKLYHECDFTHICAALIQHVNSVQASQAA